jgi:transposase
MAQVEVITGPERRRRWSEDQKREIVAASFAPGAVVRDRSGRAKPRPGEQLPISSKGEIERRADLASAT